MTGVRDLRVEYLAAPTGVATRAPRFSWIVDRAQEAYELEVRSAGVVVWATGPVESSETSLIDYGGARLASDTSYQWRVRSRSTEGWSAWSESTFDTALLDAVDWIAAWVEPEQQDAVVERWSMLDWIRGGGPDSAPEARLHPPQHLRQAFTVRTGLVRARLYATARGAYVASVNGHPADDQVLAPGSDSYAHRISVQAYDVTAMFTPGDNVLGVTLADGWWAGRLGLTGSSAQFGTRTAAIWQLHLGYGDDTTEVIASGEDVRTARGARDYADLFVGERFDRRADIAGWDRPHFDDRAWTPARIIDADRTTLRPFAGEPVRRVMELPALSVVATTEGAIVDFGQVIAGRVRLRMRATSPGQRIVIEHTETLAADGSWFDNITGINKEQTDVFIAAGGDDEWEPEFTFHGFRFARVSGLTTPLDAADIVAVVIASDLEQTGSFTTSDARLNRLHQNVVWSQRANFLSIPTDCPQREKVGWTGDLQAFIGAATNNAQVVPFVSRWLDNLRADQLPDGRIPIFSPRSPFDDEAAANGFGFGSIVAAAGWSDAIAVVPWVLYERTGDRRVIEQNYDAMTRWIEYQRTAAAEDVGASVSAVELPAERRAAQALLYNTGEHFGDWLTPSTMEGGPVHEAIRIAPALTSEYLAPMFQAQTLSIAAQIAEALDKTTDAAELRARADDVRAAFAAEYVDPSGDLPVRLQGIYVLALAFDMVPVHLRARTAERLVELVRARGDRLDTGFLSTPHLPDVLCDAGHPDVARTLLWQTEMPSWLYEVDRGATTVWEAWDAISPTGEIREMSLNHYAPGAVDDFLYRRVAGIRATSPGYRTAVIEPGFDLGVTHVRASVTTPYGVLGVEWRRAADGDTAVVEVPAGVRARLRWHGREVELAPGVSSHATDRHRPASGQPV